MLRTYLKESTEFYKNENNPLYYLFIIPKLVKSDVETVKQDQDLMNLINFVEETAKGLKLATLEKKYSPITFLNLFSTDTVKKNTIEYINEYLQNFETDLALEEKDFMASYKVHQVFDLIRNSDQFKVYTKNL
jgi:uncharacterized protein YpiB (UPF0302 family)